MNPYNQCYYEDLFHLLSVQGIQGEYLKFYIYLCFKDLMIFNNLLCTIIIL